MDYYIEESIGNRYPSLEFPLIHVCNSVETILNIIEHGFRFSYCREHFGDAKEQIELLHPMISFSHLSPNSASSILQTYGHCAIGMKKSWAVANKLTPVLYFEQGSSLTSSILEGFKRLTNVDRNDLISSIEGGLIGDKHLYYKQLIDIASYSKNFYAPLIRKDKVVNAQYCFGAESEWRVVLRHRDIVPFLTQHESKDDYNVRAHKHFIPVALTDIEYFVVEREDQEKSIHEGLMNKFSVAYEDLSNIKFHYDYSRYRAED